MVKIYDLNGSVCGEIKKMPKVFSTKYKPVVITRAVLALQSQKRQPYGASPMGGKHTSAHYHGSRHYRFTMMNKELSRIPRIHGRGAGWMAFRARFAPHAVKGRRAHPPKAEKIYAKKLNRKEHLFAIKSAIAVTSDIKMLKDRGHKIDLYIEKIKEFPVVVIDDFENMNRTKEVTGVIEKLGLSPEIDRCKTKRIRAGRGKTRGRKYSSKKGLLIVTSKECSALKSCRNIAGVDVVPMNKLNVELLAPGAQAGRLTIFTRSAFENLDNLELER
ncbi:MAG: 50S ribosomal protein L4 [Candidatus Aenigmatarchaeota archaeon]